MKESAAVVGLSMGLARYASSQTLGSDTSAKPQANPKALLVYGERSHFENAGRIGSIGALRTPLQNSVGTITPSALHYVVSHGHEPPDIDPRQHRLLIHGMVDRPLIFTMEELERLPSVARIHFIECHGNSAMSSPGGAARIAPNATVQETHGQTSCSEWTGIPLSVLFKEVDVQKGATWIVAEGTEESKHAKSIPLEKAMDDVLIAYGQNGEALRPEQGYPLRLLVPGWQGINSVKWLRRIKFVDQPYMEMMESTRYPSLRLDGKARWFESELGPKSVITRPSGGQRLSVPGFYEITGLAWSGRGSIRKVEVSTDGGRNWKEAQIKGSVHPKAHVRFDFGWNWDDEECVIQSRCTDDQGEVQPTIEQMAHMWSADLNFLKSTSVAVGNFNAIQPWKISRDGSVQNALLS